MKLTAISIDDEPRAHTVIKHYADKIEQLDLINSFTSPLQAATWLNEHSVDLVFLDINMPDLNGMSLLKTLKDPPTVIFTTAYDEYAVESYDFEAAGYLLKPIEFPKFYKSVMRVIEHGSRMSDKKQTEPETDPSSILLLKSGSKLVSIKPAKICYVEASGNYAEVITEDAKLLVDHTLSHLMDEYLPPNFIRIHRSYIINTDHLQEVESHQLKIDGQILPIGKTYRADVRKFIQNI